MSGWWNTLTLSLQIFYLLGLVAGLILVLQSLLLLLGVGVDHDFDLHGDAGGGDVGPLSLRTVTAFFFGFGWTGVIGLKSGLALPAAVGLALAVGVAFLVGVFLLMRLFVSLRSSGTLDYHNAVGATATVYSTIPAGHAGEGQVEVLVQGRLQVVHAMTGAERALAPHSKVRVTGLVDGNTLEVEPLGSGPAPAASV